MGSIPHIINYKKYHDGHHSTVICNNRSLQKWIQCLVTFREYYSVLTVSMTISWLSECLLLSNSTKPRLITESPVFKPTALITNSCCVYHSFLRTHKTCVSTSSRDPKILKDAKYVFKSVYLDAKKRNTSGIFLFDGKLQP